MNNLGEFEHTAKQLVKYQIQSINDGETSLFQVEEKILDFINDVGSLLESMILSELEEPVLENRIIVEGKPAVYKGQYSLSFKDRFGHQQSISRRSYKIHSEAGYIYPLDNELGINHCKNHSPLLSHLICSYAANESYRTASRLLSETLGFTISSTAVQNNSERIGSSMPDDPINIVPEEKQSQQSDLMILQMDGTMSPQISAIEGVTGRESLKSPTEYKECNILVVEKYLKGDRIDRWVAGDYGKRTIFEEHLRKTALKMGFLNAAKTVFIADGAKHNWEICKTHLPGAIEILDYYHAIEHLAQFCSLFKQEKKGKHQFEQWQKMIYEGDIFQVLDEMKKALFLTTNTDETQKEINYLNTNKNRMTYDEYRSLGYPIGSGLVEGQCKLVVNKRFKRNGMRWKIKDNRAILKLRLSFLNSTLSDYFLPQPFNIQFWSEEKGNKSTGIAC